jgi:hypothetical protein
MSSAVRYLLLTALLAGYAEPRIAGITITGAKFAVSEIDVREAIAAGENFGGAWGRAARFRITSVKVINRNKMQMFQKPNDEAWVFVTRKNGKWEYDGFEYIDR